MAKRFIDEEMVVDPDLRELSPEAFFLWILLLAKSDEFGVTPGDERDLYLILAFREIRGFPLKMLLEEIIDKNLGFLHDHNGKLFFFFKPDKFDYYQSRLIHKRTKSKYLKIESAEVAEIRGKLRKSAPHTRGHQHQKSIKSISKEKSKIKRDTLAVENLGGSTSDSSIPQILNSSSPDIPSQVITVIHRIGQELGLAEYSSVTDKAWRPKLIRWGEKIGYQCLLRQAENLENWLADPKNKKKLTANQRTRPTAQFFNTWLPRVFEKDYTSGDSILPVEKSNGYHSEVEELGLEKIISHDQHV